MRHLKCVVGPLEYRSYIKYKTVLFSLIWGPLQVILSTGLHLQQYVNGMRRNETICKVSRALFQ